MKQGMNAGMVPWQESDYNAARPSLPAIAKPAGASAPSLSAAAVAKPASSGAAAIPTESKAAAPLPAPVLDASGQLKHLHLSLNLPAIATTNKPLLANDQRQVRRSHGASSPSGTLLTVLALLFRKASSR